MSSTTTTTTAPTSKPIGTVTQLAEPINIGGIPHHALVTFPVSAHQRPVYRAFQSGNAQGDFHVCWGRFVVVGCGGCEHHGEWQRRHDAERFASSMACGATVREVGPYLYQTAFGRVDALDV